MKNYYRILGLSIDAEYEEIKAAYRILAQRYHPDKGGENTEFLLIKEAYDILGNPLTKRNYDKDLFHDLKQPRSIVIRKDTPQSNYFAVSIVVCLTLLALIFSVWAYLKTQNRTGRNGFHNRRKFRDHRWCFKLQRFGFRRPPRGRFIF